MAGCVQRLSNIRACTRVDTTGRLDDLALAFQSGVRALAMSKSHVRKVIDSAAVLWSIRLRIWGSEVRILPGAPANPLKLILLIRSAADPASIHPFTYHISFLP